MPRRRTDNSPVLAGPEVPIRRRGRFLPARLRVPEWISGDSLLDFPLLSSDIVLKLGENDNTMLSPKTVV